MYFLEKICSYYLSIDSVYRRSFWILFIFGNLLYLFMSANHLVGYHSYEYVDELQHLAQHAGRYTFHWFMYPLFNQWIPGHYVAWFMLYLSVAAILVARLWKIPHHVGHYVIFGALLICTPHVFSMIFYNSVGALGALCFYAIALHFALSSSRILWLMAVGLVCVSIASYQPSLAALFILVLGMFMNDFLDKKREKDFWKKYVRIIGITSLALMLYYIALKVRGFNDSYMTNSQVSDGFFYHTFKVVGNSFAIFFKNFEYELFGHRELKLTILCMGLVVLIAKVIKMKSIKIAFGCLGLIVAMFCAANFVEFVSANDIYAHRTARILLYGNVFMILYFMSVLMRSRSHWISGFSVLLGGVLIYISSTNTLIAQRNLKLATDRTLSVTIPLIARIEAMPSYNPDKRYHLYVLGYSPDYQNKIVSRQIDFTPKPHGPFTLPSYNYYWAADHFKHVGSTIKFDQEYRWKDGFVRFHFIKDKASAEKYLPLIKQMRPYPDNSSVNIIEDSIIVVFDEKVKEGYVKEAESYLTQ